MTEKSWLETFFDSIIAVYRSKHPKHMNSSKKRAVSYAIVFCLAVICLLPSLSGDYIYDDRELVGNNPHTASLKETLSLFGSNMLGGKDTGPLYRPMLMLSLYLDRAIFGHHAYAYHILNLILHGIASLLFYHLIALFAGYTIVSLVPAILFAVHPVHVDAVAFAVNRSDILALIFLLAAGIVLAGNRDRKGSLWQEPEQARPPGETGILRVVFASLLFLAALLSKEVAASAFPALLVFFAMSSIATRTRPSGMMILTMAAWSLVLLLYTALRYNALGGIGETAYLSIFPDRSLSSIVPTMSRVFADYISLLISPSSLRVDYSDYTISQTLFAGEALLSYLIHALVIGLAIWNLRRDRLLSFFIISFYIFLVPVSQIIPFRDIKAERFLYLPSIFYCLAVASPLRHLYQDKRSFRIASILILLLAAVYMSVALNYSRSFRSERALWAEMIKRSPQNQKFQYNLGVILTNSGECSRALPYLEESISKDPTFLRAYFPLGVCYMMTGQSDKSYDVLSKALSLDPKTIRQGWKFPGPNYFRADLEATHDYLKNLARHPSLNVPLRHHEIIKSLEARIKALE